jgi:hypothetical protein
MGFTCEGNLRRLATTTLSVCLWSIPACTFPERKLSIAGHLVGVCSQSRISVLRSYGTRVDTMATGVVDSNGYFLLEPWTTLRNDPPLRLLLQRDGSPDTVLKTVSQHRGSYRLVDSVMGDSSCR